MEVTAGREAGVAHPGDRVTRLDVLAGAHPDDRQMVEGGLQGLAVEGDQQPADQPAPAAVALGRGGIGVARRGAPGLDAQVDQVQRGGPADHREQAAEGLGHHGHAGDGQSDMEKMKAELAKLSPEDAASAEKQHVCPVSGKMLGTMGAPQKIDVKGQDVWICCAGCKDPLLEKPDEYLAKLKKE